MAIQKARTKQTNPEDRYGRSRQRCHAARHTGASAHATSTTITAAKTPSPRLTRRHTRNVAAIQQAKPADCRWHRGGDGTPSALSTKHTKPNTSKTSRRVKTIVVSFTLAELQRIVGGYIEMARPEMMIELVLRPASALQLTGLLQLALRHPKVDENSRRTGVTFLEHIRHYFALSPAVLELLRRGDDVDPRP